MKMSSFSANKKDLGFKSPLRFWGKQGRCHLEGSRRENLKFPRFHQEEFGERRFQLPRGLPLGNHASKLLEEAIFN